MEDVTKFDEEAYLESIKQLVNTSDGTGEVEVELVKVEFVVTVGYRFHASLDENTVVNAIAEAAGVDLSMVNVKFKRRLAAPRRLAARDVEATVKTADAASVETIAAKAENITALTWAMENQGVTDVVLNVTKKRKKAVKVTTKIISDSAEAAVDVPSAEALTFTLTEKMGVEIQAAVQNVVVENKVIAAPSDDSTTAEIIAITSTPEDSSTQKIIESTNTPEGSTTRGIIDRTTAPQGRTSGGTTVPKACVVLWMAGFVLANGVQWSLV